MLSDKYKIYVVIATYNGMEWVHKCLESLRQSIISVNVIVVDNLSTDTTTDFIQSYFPEVILIKSKENLGFGRANNIGIRFALNNNADYIYLLNQDAWIDNTTIEGLADIMEAYKDYGIISPLQYSGDGKKLDKGFEFLLSANYNQTSLDYFTEDIYTLDFVMAAHWLIRASAIKEVGDFLPLFRHYGEDKNLVSRMFYHGWKVGFSPLYKGYHDREYRKDSKEKKLHIEYVRYLAFGADINFPYVCQIKYLFLFFKKMIPIKVPLSLKINYLIRAIKNIRSIIYYRNITKRKGKHGYSSI